MAEALNHSPADVIRRVLIALGQGADPPATPWPVYSSFEPGSPDNIITTFDTTGRDHGRTAPDSERQVHHGVQVRVRANSHGAGFQKARQIALALDGIYQYTITISGKTYLLHSFNRTSEVVVIGKESPESRRSVFTVNGLVALMIIS